MSVIRNYQANLGKRQIITPATAVTNQYGPFGAEGEFSELFDTQKADENSGDLRVWTINTWIGNYTLPDIEGAKLALLGRLVWGIGSASFQADFDWKMGSQLTIAASYVRVLCAYSESGTDVPPEVAVAAMVSSGTGPGRSQVTRSFPQILMSPDNSYLFPVPPFAHALNLFALEPAFYAEGNVTIRYVAGANNGFSTASTDLASWVSDGQSFLEALSQEDGVRFPECARFVEITVADDADPYHVTPCFTLSL